jgi:hypothetical protein
VWKIRNFLIAPLLLFSFFRFFQNDNDNEEELDEESAMRPLKEGRESKKAKSNFSNALLRYFDQRSKKASVEAFYCFFGRFLPRLMNE